MPEIRLLKGDLLLALAPDEARGAAGRRALVPRRLDRATELGSLMAQLRAATRLARLRMAEGDAAGAAALVAPVLATFTEGFDTADLREARELLEA